MPIQPTKAVLTVTLDVGGGPPTQCDGSGAVSSTSMASRGRSQNQAPTRAPINYPPITLGSGANVLPIPAGTLGTTLFLTVHGNEPIALTLTQATSGDVTIPGVHGVFVMEFAEGDGLTGLSAEGANAQVSWAVLGGEA